MSKGSRGGNGPTGGGGKNGSGGEIISSSSLISERERYQGEVDSILEVLRDVEGDYGVIVEDMMVSKIKDKNGSTTLGYYDLAGNIGINEKMFQNASGLDRVYDGSVKNGFHPSRGGKTGLQAVIAHELGHRLNYVAGGSSWDKLDSSARDIIAKASRASGYKNKVAVFRSKISGYASEGGNAEAVAEAFADVYCNGSKAKSESRAVVTELNKYFKR